MSKGRRKGYIKRYFLFQLQQRGVAFLLGATFLVGVAIGIGIYCTDGGQLRQLLSSLLGAQAEGTEYGGFLPNFFTSLWSIGILLTVLFFCGFCAISQPVVLFVLLFRGLGLGLTGAYLYGCGSQGAVLYYIVVLLPEAVLSLFLLTAAAREALHFSKRFFKVLCSAVGSGEDFFSTKVYFARFLLFCILGAVISFATAVLKMLCAAFLL